LYKVTPADWLEKWVS